MKYLPILLLAVGMVAFHPAFIDHTLISIKGSRQGQFRGQSNSKGGRETEGWFEIMAFQLGSETPIDSKPGTPGGKRSHGTILIQKVKDAASPLLLEALNTGETLEVIIQTLDDSDKVVKSITLKNALVKAINKNNGENITFEYTDIVTKQ
jgi:type VI secretion system Hcp family effector